MEYRDIGENIRKYRNRLDLTQEELADKIGVTWEMVSRYERGENSPLNKLDKISNALGIPLTELIDDNVNNGYEVPLFNKIPKNNSFTKDNTTLFYSCPRWLIRRDPAIFVVNTDLIQENNFLSSDEGYVFVSPNLETNKSDLVLTNHNGVLKIEKSHYNGKKPIGRIMMQEIIFT
jgi:transcriptional regulator with XRE-family HTH domain